MSESSKNTRGGKRPGAGRKPLFDEPTLRKSIDLPKSALPAIEAAAAGQGMSVSRWLVHVALVAVDLQSFR